MPPMDDDGEGGAPDLRDYGRTLWRHRWLIILTVVLAVGVAVGYSASLQTPVYEATAEIIIQPSGTQQILNSSQQDAQDAARNVDTEVAVLESKVVQDAAREAPWSRARRQHLEQRHERRGERERPQHQRPPCRRRRQRLRRGVRRLQAPAEHRRSRAGGREDPGQDHRDRRAPSGPARRLARADDRPAATRLPPAAARPAPGVGQPQPGRRRAGPRQGRRAHHAGAACNGPQRGDRARARTPRRRRARVPPRLPRRHDQLARGPRARNGRAARARPDSRRSGVA